MTGRVRLEGESWRRRRAKAEQDRPPRPPRRRRERGEALRTSPFWVIGGVVFAAVAVLAATALQQPVPTGQDDVVIEPIGSLVLLCPEPGAASDLGVRVTAAVVPGQAGQQASDGTGSAGLRTLPGRTSAESRIRVPGGQAEIEAFGGTELPAIEAYGEGTLAPGLVADQWGRDPGGAGRGLASTACAPASSESWFVGGGAIAGRQTRIVLVNPDETAAIVDVIIRGPEGVIDAPGGRGLVVGGQDRLVVRLDTLAPGVAATAVQVLARTGRVGASVDDEQRSGLANVGSDWVPQAARPATKVYVPGVINGAGARVLSIAAPGADDAIVTIRVIAEEGTFSPADRARVDVPADSVVALDMSPVLSELPVTLELTSTVPIIAGMRQFLGNETSFSAGAQPHTSPAAVTGLPVRTATELRVAITAPESDATVEVSLLPFRRGREASQPTGVRRLTIPAGTMRWVRVSPPTGVDWYTAVVTPLPDSGPVVVAHRLKEKSQYGDLITGYPWPALRTQVRVPSAVQDPGVGTG